MFKYVLGDYQVEPLGKRVGTDVEFGKGGLTIGLESEATPYAPGNFEGRQVFGIESGNEPADLLIGDFPRP